MTKQDYPTAKRNQRIAKKKRPMKNIRQSIQQFISLEGFLKGKGGEAIRNYYEDVHIPFLTYWVPFPLFE
ncbi:T7SS effector LXG polymorphic toxin [Parageobacillus thermoglucosidasius]|uniref:T7SS effector LXG polymorphic toxin n=1 Tax=Parageobacillus thermoglucosidasius TaxID=1426 RepID=UPI00394C27C7|nr:hypothetical protein [Parageobacillus thermoglucosidasius]